MTLRSFANAVALAGTVLGVLAGAAWAYAPAASRSFAGWLAFAFLGLPMWMCMERVGDSVLESRLFARRSRAVRILVGVPVITALVAAAAGCIWLVERALRAA